MDLNLLKRVCETAGAPGFESEIRNLVISEIKDVVDEYHVDNLGNLICLKKGADSSKKVMIAAHLDEIGFIVSHIEDNGFIRFQTLGGFDPKTLTAQRVTIHGKSKLPGVMGTKPVHVLSPEERKNVPDTKEYFIDAGLPKAEVEKLVSIGDPITWQRDFIEIGDCVNCKSIDNRVSVFILIEALKQMKNMPYDVYGVFTVQEEVGLRGANVSAHTINPDFGIALDTTVAFDVPGAQPHEMITKLGKGAAIKIMDGMTICDYRMVRYMKQVADVSKITWQPEILPAGGTDTAGLQRMGENGAISGAISIPTRFLHQAIEMAHKEDIEGVIELLTACVEELDKFEWKHD